MSLVPPNTSPIYSLTCKDKNTKPKPQQTKTLVLPLYVEWNQAKHFCRILYNGGLLQFLCLNPVFIKLTPGTKQRKIFAMKPKYIKSAVYFLSYKQKNVGN